MKEYPKYVDSLCTKQSYHTDNIVKKKSQWAADFDCEQLIRNFVESGLKYIFNLKKVKKRRRRSCHTNGV